MRLGALLAALPAVRLPRGELNEEICSLVTDSRHAGAGSLFVCLRGPERDGHDYARAAYARGCRAFVCEYPPSDLPADARLIFVADSVRALAALSSAWYSYPERDLTLIGITGTKGKTTTAMMLYHLLKGEGVACGYIGSGGALYGNVMEKNDNTTPAAPELRRIFSKMRRAGVTAAVVEVSSQALSNGRVLGLSFPLCLYTNLAEDHIGDGEHPDVAHYREAKAKLFSDYGCRHMVFNADDENAGYMLAEASATHTRAISCLRSDADLYATRIRPQRLQGALATSFFLHSEEEGAFPLSIPLPGECNVGNALLALSAAQEYFALCGKEPPTLRALAAHMGGVKIPGRFALLSTPLADVDFVIDYAHNGYSIPAAIAALRAYEPRRLVCLFGSVGGRTYSRRAELARAACGADFCIVTSDNPGDEPPEDTMREICAVLEERGQEYIAIPDRAEAIRYAVRHARTGDMVLLAGKGHEDFQLIGARRIPFSERDILLHAAEERESVPL